jgi:prephenate dehydrogenase
VHWNKISLVGVGLLGGSLGLALRRGRMADTVAGYVRRTASVRECKRAGAADLVTQNLSRAVEQADLIVLCTPVAQMRPLVEQMLPALKPGAVITDVGSVKSELVSKLEGCLARRGVHFVGSHPMAGSEKVGVAAARGDLFNNSICVVTPTPKSDKAAVRSVERLWKQVGARVLRLTPEEHDVLVSRSSHLTHVVAAALANVVLDPARPPHQRLLCANGFRDATRVASGSPEMWRDIVLANRANLTRALDELQEQLSGFRRLLKRGDPETVMRFFEQAKQRRDLWAEAGKVPPRR